MGEDAARSGQESPAAAPKVPVPAAGLRRIILAGGYSLSGLWHAVRHEAAFRQEVMLACVAIPAALLIKVSAELKLILVLAMLAVLVTELLNTGLEALADRLGKEYNPLIKQAKDMGSAAVLLSLTGLAAAWALAFYRLAGNGA